MNTKSLLNEFSFPERIALVAWFDRYSSPKIELQKQISLSTVGFLRGTTFTENEILSSAI
jgi:hypothetical protein